MLYQLSYTPKSQRRRCLAARPWERKAKTPSDPETAAAQAAATKPRFSSSIALAVEAATGLEKI
jgi:hypothetical protein